MKTTIRKATHWVLEYGSDCDGQMTSGTVYEYANETEGHAMLVQCIYSSDGMTYMMTNDWDFVRMYCSDFGLDADKYKYVYTNN